MEISDSVVIKEVSDSNSSTNLLAKSKRTSRHKGVVLQQNGHYGCQIYANHQRIWLGTFKSEEEAIMAYDSASLKLRGSDSPRNFPFTEATATEIKFQSYHSNEAVVNMIKDGSYQSKFADYLKMSKNVENELDFKARKMQNNHGVTYRQMFQKELTPSDVGKLNRLVIPKKYATKFFPQAPQETEENSAVDNPDDVQLSFYDNSMKLWKFRYCYWKSSQSYVFTRGWNRFVKEKQVKANDIVSFSLREFVDNVKGTRSCFMIDAIPSENDSSGMSAMTNHSNAMEEELQFLLKPSGPYNVTEEADVRGEPKHDAQENKAGRKRVKLFGVQIN